MEIKAKAGLNKVGKVLAASVALGACAAYAAPENNWQGGSENTEVSRTSNWSQGYVPTANMRFLTDSAGKTVTFDQLVNMTDYMWLGSTTAGAFFTQAAGETAEVFNPVVWTATHETNGIHQTAGSLRFADFSNQNAGLVINGGTYTTDAEVWIGKMEERPRSCSMKARSPPKATFLCPRMPMALRTLLSEAATPRARPR